MNWKIFSLGIAVILLVAIGLSRAPKSEPEMNEQTTALESKVTSEIVKVGDGAEAKSGDTVSVHYTGMLTDGTTFDSSRPRGEPFRFSLGSGEVIPGWDQGIVGMKVGEIRKLTIPPELAYETRGVPGTIPQSATLLFEVELLTIEPS